MQTQFPIIGWVLLYAFLVSGLSYVLMFWDKKCAIKGRRRIPEATLLMWAFLGGALGAKIGQKAFRHKTKKEPFRTWLNGWVLLNAISFAILLIPSARMFFATVVFGFFRGA